VAADPPTPGVINPYAAPETPVDLAGMAGPSAHDLTRDEVAAYVGPKSAYYWRAWQRARGGGLRAGFNWAACIFNLGWLLYRKMYREFLIGFGASFGASFALAFIGAAAGKGVDGLDRVVNLGLAVTVGMLGNGLYLRRARQAIGTARTQVADPAERALWLTTHGGTSVLSLLIGLGISVAIGLLVGLASVRSGAGP
jgi:hypothetical protein